MKIASRMIIVLLAILGLMANVAWSQPSTSTTMRLYEADAAYARFFNEHKLICFSRSSHGEQVDIVRQGQFLVECYIDGSAVRMRRCGNVVYQIAAEVQVTINIPPCANGTNGTNGVNGARGEQGDRGDKGDKGDTGAAGVNGRDGRDGINGRNGVDGRDGYLLVQQMPRYGICGTPFSGGCSLSPQYQTYVDAPREGWVDYLGRGLGGWVSNAGIRPARTEISLNNGSSSTSAGGNATATQRQGQGQQQGQVANNNNSNTNSNSNTNNNTNSNANSQNVGVDVDTDVGVVNSNATAVN